MRRKRNENHSCVICKHLYTEPGHDAEPVAKGFCCNRCNSEKVIPARIRQMRQQLEKDGSVQ